MIDRPRFLFPPNGQESRAGQLQGGRLQEVLHSFAAVVLFHVTSYLQASNSLIHVSAFSESSTCLYSMPSRIIL
jgi:hypothetical protein